MINIMYSVDNKVNNDMPILPSPIDSNNNPAEVRVVEGNQTVVATEGCSGGL